MEHRSDKSNSGSEASGPLWVWSKSTFLRGECAVPCTGAVEAPLEGRSISSARIMNVGEFLERGVVNFLVSSRSRLHLRERSSTRRLS